MIANYPPVPLASEVKEVASAISGLATLGKFVDCPPICDLWVRAFLRAGHNAQGAAALLKMTPAQFSKDFSPNWPDNAPTLKRLDSVAFDIKREFFGLGAAACGLQVGIDWEDRQVLRRFAELLKEVG